ncbi:MAG: hypothetical protein R3B84_14735 [Zavarzinella sp.]
MNNVCPTCGHPWFVATGNGTKTSDPTTSGMVDLIAAQLGVPTHLERSSRLAELNLDSLDLVEFIMDDVEQK